MTMDLIKDDFLLSHEKGNHVIAASTTIDMKPVLAYDEDIRSYRRTDCRSHKMSICPVIEHKTLHTP